jgi:type II secretory pathway predicted ATPase ExeA
MLEYSFSAFAPITVITGEIGAGKTTLIQHLIGVLPREIRIGVVSHTYGEQNGILRWVLDALDAGPVGRVSELNRLDIFRRLLRSEAAQGRHTLLIFDEAQNLSHRMLEQLRCLSNLNTGREELLQIVLVGQPELRLAINHDRTPQFAQRVSVQFHLDGMTRESVALYIAHRLQVAGATRPIFSSQACDLIHQVSRGLPRPINQICEHALVCAYAEGSPSIDEGLIEKVLFARAQAAGATSGAARSRFEPTSPGYEHS